MTKEEAVALGVVEADLANLVKNNNEAHDGIRELIKAYHKELKEVLIPVVYRNRDRGKKHSIYWKIAIGLTGITCVAVLSAFFMGLFA